MTHPVMMVDPPLLPMVTLRIMDLIMVYAVGAASNITPDAVHTVKLDDNRNVHLDLMLYAAAVFAAAQDIWLNRVPSGSPIAEGGGICVGIVNNNVMKAGADIVGDGIATTHTLSV